MKRFKRKVFVFLMILVFVIQNLYGMDMGKVLANEDYYLTGDDSVNPTETLAFTATETPSVTAIPGGVTTPDVSLTGDTGSNGDVSSTPDVGSLAAIEATPEVSEDMRMRVMFTTDLHGRLDTNNYETGGVYSNGGMARAAKLIKQRREDYGTDNTFLFDLGDVLYDYTSDYIYEQDENALQPMYSALSALGYDAITLGNHEFDYTLDYIQKQLKKSGMEEKVVVSNVQNAKTGKPVWKDTMIIEKEMIAESGDRVLVKVGIIGETVPSLSSKRTSYVGVLKTEDIVKNAQNKAKYLKESGADLVIALAHSGIGEENPALNAEDCGYALTKIPEIDMVLCGHKHEQFPVVNYNSSVYYQLPNVDSTSGLVNGKNLIMLPSNGKAVGQVDLKLHKENNQVTISERKSTVLSANANVLEDSDIANNHWQGWKYTFITNCSTILAEIATDERWYNYFGEIEDNGVIQLVNDIKKSIAMKYINTTMTEYKDLPILSESTYLNDGSGSPDNYVDISGNLLLSYIANLRDYKTGFYMYKINGEVLKEWLEWSVSGYTDGTEKNDGELLDETDTPYLLKKEWRDDWSSMYIFDGVDYTVDISKKARYDIEGNKISDDCRISNLTIDGVAVGSQDEMIVAGIRMKANGTLPKEIINHKIYSSSTEKYRTWFQNYIDNAGMNGSLKARVDNNWKIVNSKQSKYIIKTSSLADQLTEDKKWISKKVAEKNGYSYYEIDLSKVNQEDKSAPNIVVANLNDVETNRNVEVKVKASDPSGVRKIQYTYGKFSVGAIVWDNATSINDDSIICLQNGVYSVRAEDNYGNARVVYFRINNINKSVLQAPIVSSFTNRKTKVTGTAEPGANLFIELENGKIYKTVVKDNGKFSKTIAAQYADKNLYVYAVDLEGRASARTVVTVKRTGPNKITANQINSNSRKITGNAHDTYVDVIMVVDDSVVYVPKNGGFEKYCETSIFDADYTVREMDYSMSGEKFTITLPRLLSGGSSVRFYAIDTENRISLSTNKTVVQQLPNRPEIEGGKVNNNQTSVEVVLDERCKVVVNVNGKNYGYDDVEFNRAEGKYHYEVSIPKGNSGDVVSVYAVNVKGKGKVRKYYRKEYAPNTPTIGKAKAGKKIIRGTVHLIGSEDEPTVKNTGTVVYFLVGSKKYKALVHNNGTFRVVVKKMKKGTKIYYWAENNNGVGKRGSVVVR